MDTFSGVSSSFIPPFPARNVHSASGTRPRTILPAENNTTFPSLKTRPLTRSSDVQYWNEEDRRCYLKMLFSVRDSCIESQYGLAEPDGIEDKNTARYASYYPKTKYQLARLDHSVPQSEAFLRGKIRQDEETEWTTMTQMASLSYLTLVIAPRFEQLLEDERRERCDISCEEEASRYAMQTSVQCQRLTNHHLETHTQTISTLRNRIYSSTCGSSGDITRGPTPIPPATHSEEQTYFQLQRFVRERHRRALEEQSTTAKEKLMADHRRKVAREFLLNVEDSERQTRAVLLRNEASDRASIGDMFVRQKEVGEKLAHKRLHLQRLVYWRHQRDKGNSESGAKSGVLSDGDDDASSGDDGMNGSELQIRFMEEKEQLERRKMEEMQRTSFLACQSEFIDTLAEQLVTQRATVEMALWATISADGVNLLCRKEELERKQLALVEQSTQDTLMTEFARVSAEIETATNVDKIRAAVVIQTTFRRHKGGKLGWRHTNREIGRTIAAGRSEKKIAAGAASLQEMKRRLLKEEEDILSEAAQCEQDEREMVLVKETIGRRVLVENEETIAAQLLEQWREVLADQIVFPTIQSLETEEIKRRHRIALQEEVGTLLLRCGWCSSHEAWRTVVEEEESSRVWVAMEEYSGRDDLAMLHVAQTSLIPPTETDETRWLEAKQDFLEVASRQHAHLLATFQLGALSLSAIHGEPHRAMYEAYSTTTANCWASLAGSLHKTEGNALLFWYTQFLTSGVAECVFEEEVSRQSILEEYASTLHDMLENDPFARSERQRREKAAVQVIESQYEKYRRSKERAVLSQYLTQGEDSTDVVIYLQLYALYTRSEPRDREWVCLEEEAQFARLREMYINGV